MNIIEYSDRDNGSAWNDFVFGHESGTFFHRIEWRQILQSAFGLSTCYLCAETGGRIEGVLPLAVVRRPIMGNALISTPLCVYGGALSTSPEITAALEDEAVIKAQALGVQYLELRNQYPTRADWPSNPSFYTFRKRVEESDEANLKCIPRKQRAEIRKAFASDLRTERDSDHSRFYDLYRVSVRNLGTPVFPKRYLSELSMAFGRDLDVVTVTLRGAPVCSVLNFYFRDQVMPYYAGGVEAARSSGAYMLMYWEVMRRAVQRGVRVFDFGRSMAGTGPFAFKKNWGFTPEPLAYEYALLKTDRIPSLDPQNARNRRIMAVWRRLPLAVTDHVGPWLYPVVM